MKTTMLFLTFAILTAAALAQGEKVRVLAPVRIAVIASAGADWDLRGLVVRELQSLRKIEVSADRPDITVQLAAERFKGDCRGVVAAVFIRSRAGNELHVIAGADWQEIARSLAGTVKEVIEAEK